MVIVKNTILFFIKLPQYIIIKSVAAGNFLFLTGRIVRVCVSVVFFFFFNLRNVEKHTANFALRSISDLCLRSDLCLNDHEYIIYLARYTRLSIPRSTDIGCKEKQDSRNIKGKFSDADGLFILVVSARRPSKNRR